MKTKKEPNVHLEVTNTSSQAHTLDYGKSLENSREITKGESTLELLKEQITELKRISQKHETMLDKFQSTMESTKQENEKIQQVLSGLTDEKGKISKLLTSSFSNSYDPEMMELSCFSPVLCAENSTFMDSSLLCLDELESQASNTGTSFECAPKRYPIFKSHPKKKNARSFTSVVFDRTHIPSLNI